MVFVFADYTVQDNPYALTFYMVERRVFVIAAFIVVIVTFSVQWHCNDDCFIIINMGIGIDIGSIYGFEICLKM